MINVQKGYRLSGSFRQIGAIGVPESFRVELFAGSARRAYKQFKENRYQTHDHILVKSIERYNRKTRKWVKVNPVSYL